ncbi:unnamed protein product [Paramecium octaurelia]|uniref:Uncharacterized protein n=1 Tax=Paramecium octaurelia TaxID=43137 RepID=A0A8S1YEI9_PAROT|nr:unnamed protein product [Paramecium octaurelia]
MTTLSVYGMLKKEIKSKHQNLLQKIFQHDFNVQQLEIIYSRKQQLFFTILLYFYYSNLKNFITVQKNKELQFSKEIFQIIREQI